MIGVASDMKPSTRIDNRRVPTLQCVVGIRKLFAESMKSVSYKFQTNLTSVLR